MKFHKRLLLVVLVAMVGILGISAASASAAVWKHGGSNLAKHTEIGLTGGEVFETGTGGMSCEVFATITTSGGSTGTIKKWEVKNCAGFGDLASCSVLATEPKNLAWALDVNTADLTITNMRIRRTFKAGCKISELDKTVASMTVTPDVKAAITSFEFLGTNGTYKQFGSLNVNAPNVGTYGIG